MGKNQPGSVRTKQHIWTLHSPSVHPIQLWNEAPLPQLHYLHFCLTVVRCLGSGFSKNPISGPDFSRVRIGVQVWWIEEALSTSKFFEKQWKWADRRDSTCSSVCKWNLVLFTFFTLNEPVVFFNNGVKSVDERWFVLDIFLNIEKTDLLFFFAGSSSIFFVDNVSETCNCDMIVMPHRRGKEFLKEEKKFRKSKRGKGHSFAMS